MAWHLITSLLSLCTNLLPSIGASAHAPSSSSSCGKSERRHAAAEEMERLMRTLERIKATLDDAEEREIRDRSVKLWLKELKGIAYEAQNLLAEYRYEVTRVQLEARKASGASGSKKRKQMEYAVPIYDGMLDQLNKIRSKFDEIAKHREALQLKETDGVRCRDKKVLPIPTGHIVDETNIFGRNAEIEKVIDCLLAIKENPFPVISIIGKGGLGKTTIAQIVYKDTRVRQYFDLFGWVCVSEDFNVNKIIRGTIESVKGKDCVLSELSSLQEELAKTVNEKRMLLVLDDVWNENQNLWELFRVAFKVAKQVSFLVTTRNENIAKVMQTTAHFRPNYLPEDSSWQLFQHCAFGGTNHTVSTHFTTLGRDISRKCGGLPLAVKSIASLLRHEADEKSWRDILESDFWESNPSNDIFPALQISYYHLPAHLKPCFLLASMYPKDYVLTKDNLILLWISHGYVESEVRRKLREVGAEYYEELKERSFLDDSSNQFFECCKLHDIIHDLARLNSEKEYHSVEIYKPLDFQEGIILQGTYHLYVKGSVGYFNQILHQNFAGLRTLSTALGGCNGDLEHQYCIKAIDTMPENLNLEQFGDYKYCRGIFNLTKFESLTALELYGRDLTKIPKSISKLKLLSYLKITSSSLRYLTSSIGLLYNLQILILECFWSPLNYLPESIGNLTNLQYLRIECDKIEKLPKSLCLLSNLQILVISTVVLDEVPSDLGKLCNLQELTINSLLMGPLPCTIGSLDSLEKINISRSEFPEFPFELENCRKLKTLKFHGCLLNYNPRGLENFLEMRTMETCLNVRTIAWLKHMKGLEGELIIEGLKNMSNLVDAQQANLKSKCRIETLDLCWHNNRDHYHEDDDFLPEFVSKGLRITLVEERDGGGLVGPSVNFHLLEYLQPHPKLKRLKLDGYPSATLPDWMGQPFSLQAIQGITLQNCDNLQSLPFNNLNTLKHVRIISCSSIRFLQLEQLPSQLKDLTICDCGRLEMIYGVWHMERLADLTIVNCRTLKSIRLDELQLGETTRPLGDSSYEKPPDNQKSASTITTWHIFYCPSLLALPDGLIPCGCAPSCKKAREMFSY